MGFFLGIDVGTTNWKAAIYDEHGILKAINRTKTITHYDDQGRATYNPEEMWEHVAKVVKTVVSKVNPWEITGVSVTSMAESGVPIDKYGKATYPVIAWFDLRTLPQSQQLEKILGRKKIFAITGLDNNPIFSLPKIMWIRQHEPEAFSQTVKWLSITDFIYWKLANVYATDYSIASRTLALDIAGCTWSEELLKEVRLPVSFFPDIYKSGESIGKVTRKAAEATGLKEGTPVVTGGHDHLCGLLASGASLTHNILDSSGTAESIIALSPKDAVPPSKFNGFRVGRYLDPRFYATWGGVISSGSSVDWAVSNFATLKGWSESNSAYTNCSLDYKQVISELKKTTPENNKIIFLPHLRGCGAPYWDPKSHGAFLGLRSIHNQRDMVRAVIEGLCFEVKQIIEGMEDNLGYQTKALTTIGGGARNHFWLQTKADITGRPVEVPEVEESTVLGAALLAGVGTGVFHNLNDAVKKTYRLKRRFTPNPDHKNFYKQKYEVYKSVYPLLSEVNYKLNDLL